MNREIKFRGLQNYGDDWIYGSLLIQDDEYLIYPQKSSDSMNSRDHYEVNPETVGQFTGLHDKNGKEIYEGDIIRYRTPIRTTQTHTGDNIPNGSYTEPMEPAIQTCEEEVFFKDGVFAIYEQDPIPLFWISFTDYDESSIRSAVEIGKDGWDIWDDEEEGDLQYLMEDYKCKTKQDLIDYCNLFEVIGNIYEEQYKHLIK